MRTMRKIQIKKLLFYSMAIAGIFLIRKLYRGFVASAFYASRWEWYLPNRKATLLYYGLAGAYLCLFLLVKRKNKDMGGLSLYSLIVFPGICFLALLLSGYTPIVWWGFYILLAVQILRYFYGYLWKLAYARRWGLRLRKKRVIKRYLLEGMTDLVCLLLVAAGISSCSVLGKRNVWEDSAILGVRQEDFMEEYQREPHSYLTYLESLKLAAYEVASETERLETLQRLADVEAQHMKVERVALLAQYMESSDRKAYYRQETNQVVVNRYVLANPTSYYAAEILLHEMHHAFAHSYVNGEKVNEELFRYEETDPANWKAEFDNYKVINGWSTKADYEEYAGQEVELAARNYAKRRVVQYYRALEGAGNSE